jgi:hypothetical protein
MRDGFPNTVAVGLALAFAFALSLLVFVAFSARRKLLPRARRFPPPWSVEEQRRFALSCAIGGTSSISDRRPTFSGAVSASRTLMWFRCS